MATKEENLNRLRQLADLLGREADMSGSAADIAQRVSEWEEELAVSPENEIADVDDTVHEQACRHTGEDDVGILERIRLLKCFYLCGVDDETGEPVEHVDAGRVILMPPSVAKDMIQHGTAVYA
ncbi:DNA packaging FI family protein [Escherichia coli 1-182-04_S4_C3]|uniref:DNA-packaging protein FI n=1 Tax=Escherichia coli TaxID=562 RepID=UPI000448DF84|nr:DNA-packaging protein FI [Escherichia coli]EZJ12560.1 DNA packaging FI family protein [Escherichia coli 1-182-04_S4_C3]